MSEEFTISPNERVLINNTRDWTLSFESAEHSGMGIMIQPHQSIRITYAELEAQVQNPDGFFYGTDGLGNHAAIVVVDEKVRNYVFGLGKNAAAQETVTLDYVTKLLKTDPVSAFEAKLKKEIMTDGDKRMLVRLAYKAGLDDVKGGSGKRKAIEKWCGYSIVEEDDEEKEGRVTTVAPQ